jgi:ABC-type uncharacterized transport system permease subunit
MGNTPEHSLVEDLQSTIDARGMQIGDVLGQARQLTTVSGLAFGFLLSIAANYEIRLTIGNVLVSIALVSTATAIFISLLPLLYIQLSSPMDKKQTLQFYVWSRKFILWGVVPLAVGVYCAVLFALSRLFFRESSIIAAMILVLPLILYGLRRIGDPPELA